MENKDSRIPIILGYFSPKNEELLANCIESLEKQTYQNYEVYIYDNSTIPNALDRIKKRFPDVKVNSTGKNSGFAGGNNRVMREILKDKSIKYLVLLNDDTIPNSDWLEELVKAGEDKSVGAVSSKLLFYEDYIRLNCTVDTFNPSKEGSSSDSRDLGIKVYKIKLKNSQYNKAFYRKGFYGFEDDELGRYTWTKDQFSIDVPIGTTDTLKGMQQIEIEVETPESIKNKIININIGGEEYKVELKSGFGKYTFEISAKSINKNKVSLIQNAGSGITAQYQGYDIGSTQSAGDLTAQPEVDKGQYDNQTDLEMFCGAAVLLKTEILRKVGIFDQYLFMYYEDADLSLRIRRAGYKIAFAPKAVVRHIHAGSSGEWSPFFNFHINKNRIAFVTKNFGIKAIVYTWIDLIKAAIRDGFKPLLKSKFKNNYAKIVSKVYMKVFFSAILNTPIHILKRFNIIKSK